MNGELEQLAQRVRWLDRYQRVLALGAAVVFATWFMWQLPSAVRDEWLQAHVGTIGLVVGLAGWGLAEVVLAFCAAVWETQHDQLQRAGGIPRAAVFRR